MKKHKTQKGFTLIEVLVSISIFSVFITSVVTAYLNIAQSQRQANLIRGIYSENRYLMTLISDEARSKTIDYSCYPNADNLLSRRDEISGVCQDLSTGINVSNYLALINAEGNERTIFKVENGVDIILVKMYKEKVNEDGKTWLPAKGFSSSIFQPISLEKMVLVGFQFDINPIVDPYDVRNVYCDTVQFQPSVTINASIKGVPNSEAQNFTMDLQTSVSSRLYNKQTTLY